MIKVDVKKQSNYPINSPSLKKIVRDFFTKNGIVSNAEVSIVLVGETKMFDLGKKYLKDKILHNVLSFTEEEMQKKFVYPPDNIIRLGEIVICYPKAFEEAKAEGKLIDDKIKELVEHGALHLLGIHHEE